jgi:hypothetical protein
MLVIYKDYFLCLCTQYIQPPVCKTSMNFYQTTQHDMTQDTIDIYRYILLVSVIELRDCDIDTLNISLDQFVPRSKHNLSPL